MKKLITVILLIVCFNVKSQEAITVSGGNVSDTNGSVSYSFGQILFNSKQGVNGFELEGVQQPFEISVITGNEELIECRYTLSAYPNPAISYFNLMIENIDSTNFSLQLFNTDGKLLSTIKPTNKETRIELSSPASAIYLLKVIKDNKAIKTFKIVKN
jgi:hypothetical protein